MEIKAGQIWKHSAYGHAILSVDVDECWLTFLKDGSPWAGVQEYAATYFDLTEDKRWKFVAANFEEYRMQQVNRDHLKKLDTVNEAATKIYGESIIQYMKPLEQQQETCKCDIKYLMDVGHTPGCPEGKEK